MFNNVFMHKIHIINAIFLFIISLVVGIPQLYSILDFGNEKWPVLPIILGIIGIVISSITLYKKMN